MTPRLVAAQHIGAFVLRLVFADGKEGEVDLESELWGEVFEPLRDPDMFRQFTLDRELNTVTWPTGADLAPEFLYARVTARAR